MILTARPFSLYFSIEKYFVNSIIIKYTFFMYYYEIRFSNNNLVTVFNDFGFLYHLIFGKTREIMMYIPITSLRSFLKLIQ